MTKLEALNEKIELLEKEGPDKCLNTAQTYARISGYYRAIDYWNDGKKQEFAERVEYDLK